MEEENPKGNDFFLIWQVREQACPVVAEAGRTCQCVEEWMPVCAVPSCTHCGVRKTSVRTLIPILRTVYMGAVV